MKIGSIGTGFITDWVMGSLVKYPENEYTAIYSRKEESAQTLKDKYNVKKVYTDLDAMLADEEIDCIYVASPNSLHYEHSIKAMKAGKNVICEKPFASNVKECEEMIRVSKETNTFLFEAITVPYNLNYKEIKNHLPKFGKVRIVECNMSQYSSKYDAYLANKNPNVFTAKYSGGALMDLGVYNIHYVYGLFGMPEDVQYFATLNEDGVDLGGVVIMKYPEFVATCVASKNSIGSTFTQIQGENGYIYSDLASSLSKNVKVQIRKGEYQEIDLQEGCEHTHYYYAGEMLKMVQENDRARCDEMLNVSLDVMKIIEKCKESAGIVFDADK